jgi:hypothetical protein
MQDKYRTQQGRQGVVLPPLPCYLSSCVSHQSVINICLVYTHPSCRTNTCDHCNTKDWVAAPGDTAPDLYLGNEPFIVGERQLQNSK